MSGFVLNEVGFGNERLLWQRGGFPLSYLATDDHDSMKWRLAFVRAFVERDAAVGYSDGARPSRANGRASDSGADI